MSMNIIILLPILSGFGLLYWATQLEEDYAILKLLFQLMFVPFCWLSIHFAVIDATITYASNTDLVSLLADVAYYLGWVAFIIGVAICFIIFKNLYNLIMQKRKSKKEARYE
jgi:hypothetical protein